MSYSRSSSGSSINSGRGKGKAVRIDSSAINSDAYDLSSYKLITASYPCEVDYEGDPVDCQCWLKAFRWTAWTTENPGRRFYGCPKFPDPRRCGFVSWHDEEFGERDTELILELAKRERWLLMKCREKEQENSQLKAYEENSHGSLDVAVAELYEGNAGLKTEIVALRKQLEEALREKVEEAGKIEKKKDCGWFHVKAICVAYILTVIWKCILA